MSNGENINDSSYANVLLIFLQAQNKSLWQTTIYCFFLLQISRQLKKINNMIKVASKFLTWIVALDWVTSAASAHRPVILNSPVRVRLWAHHQFFFCKFIRFFYCSEFWSFEFNILWYSHPQSESVCGHIISSFLEIHQPQLTFTVWLLWPWHSRHKLLLRLGITANFLD